MKYSPVNKISFGFESSIGSNEFNLRGQWTLNLSKIEQFWKKLKASFEFKFLLINYLYTYKAKLNLFKGQKYELIFPLLKIPFLWHI